MKKNNQNNLDLDMINLDETAGWNQLEVESALADENKKDDVIFQGEITISEEELCRIDSQKEEFLDDEDEYIEEEYDEEEYVEEEYDDEEEYIEEPVVVPKKKVSKKKPAQKAKGKRGKRKKNQTIGDKIVAAFRQMTVLDGVIATTGVLVLAVAIFTVSVYSSAKAAEAQVAAFAPLGEDMEYLTDAGKGVLLAMADSERWVVAKEEEETISFEYEEKELEDTVTINVNMKLTSVQKDLKVKFVNFETGKLISSVPFEISITDSAQKTKEYKDDDMDGIIYLKDMTPGKASVTMLVLNGKKGLAFNTAPQTINIKDKIEYKKIDVEDEVKSESEVNAAAEDTAKENVVEAELADTVEWVESSKTEVGQQETFVKVKKATIPDPATLVKASSIASDVCGKMEETVLETESKEKNPDTETTEETPETKEDGDLEEEETKEEEKPGKPEKPSEEEPSKEEPSKEDENPAKNDKESLLKDQDGNQMYKQKASGEYVEAKYADYYKEGKKFFKKVMEPIYKYTGWQNFDGKTYFYTKDGEKVTGEQVIQGAKYTFDTEGVLLSDSGTLGIDVSKWNGNIDWNAVKSSGVSYVIIRCGYRGSSTGAMIEDPMFKTNIKGATNAGLKVGVYFFSQAVNEVEAVEEASMTLGLIKKYSLSYPIFLDVEASGGRADGIDRNTRTKVIKAYCETIRNSGYTAGVYANKTWLESYMNAGELGAYKIWLAQYNTAPTYTGKVDMWQYSSKGKVNGISGNTDMNLSYMGF